MSFNSETTRVAGGPLLYYTDYTTTNLYVQKSFGGAANTITMTNDSASDPVQCSFDGATLETDLKSGETLSINVAGKTSIYIKGTAGGDNVRIWAW